MMCLLKNGKSLSEVNFTDIFSLHLQLDETMRNLISYIILSLDNRVTHFAILI